MVDLFKAETVNSDILIDEKMSIVTADENFEALSGNNALFVYTRYIHPDDVSRFTEALKDYADSGKFIVVRMLYQTGEYHWMLTRITDGGVSETRGHMYDINIIDAALITTQIDNLNSQIERYSSYLGMCENVLFSYDILNDDFNIFMTSDGHQTLSFYRGTLNAWEEDKIKIDALGLNEVKELDGFCKALANGEKLFKREITINILNKPGRLDRCLARGNTIVDAYGNSIVIGTIIILESSDNHVVEELNIISDMKDPGTDLLNKRAITDYVRKLIDSQPGHTVTIAIIDIDDFKTINDMYGHAYGDVALKVLSEGMQKFFDKNVLLGRNGGDEFCIFLPDCTCADVKEKLEEFTKLKRSFKYEGEEHQFTISVGYAEYPVHADKPSKLMRCADTALYEVKLRGKNGCMAYKNGLRKDIRTQLGFALKDVSENLPGAFIIYKADKNDDEILFANREFIRFAGCKNMDELLVYTKRSFRNIIRVDEREAVIADIWKQIDEGHTNGYTHFYMQKADGGHIQVFDHGRIVENGRYGRVIYALITNLETVRENYGNSECNN